ncbi:MAG: hypothetical protein AAGE52_09845 [Myxococcota bacterium]
MTHVLKLIEEFAKAEADLRAQRFLSPCVPGATLRIRVNGLVYVFRPNPPGFAGWGLFQAIDARRAQLVARPERALVARYLARLPSVRLHLVRKIRRKAWWAVPSNAEGFRRRFGRDGPVVVHLAKDVAPFDTIVARYDGATFWFEGPDLFADPVLAEALTKAFRSKHDVHELQLTGVTPELIDAFIWARLHQAKHEKAPLEQALESALRIGGGFLDGYRETEGNIVVQWRDRQGHRHSSALARGALEVRAAGAVCLQGRDSDFDLASLVGVMSDAPDYFYDDD